MLLLEDMLVDMLLVDRRCCGQWKRKNQFWETFTKESQKSAKLKQWKGEDVKRGGVVGQFNLGVWKGWMKMVVKDG